MRRSVTLAAAVFVVVAGVSGCTGSSEPAAPSSVNAVGDPLDTASPVDTAPPRPSEPAVTPTPTASATGAPTDLAAAALATCLVGNWGAPVAREFDGLGLRDQSRGAVRAGSGDLRLTLGRDSTFRFTYDAVKLTLAAGTASVTGPVEGTWSLAGGTMRTVLVSSATKVTVSLAGVTVGAPSSLVSAVQTLPPAEVRVTCTPDQLVMDLPSSQGGGKVTFDRT